MRFILSVTWSSSQCCIEFCCVSKPQFIHSTADKHLDFLWVVAIMNGAAVNIFAQVNLYISIRYRNRSGISGSLFSISRYCQIVLWSSSTNLYSHQHYMNIPFFLDPDQLGFLFFLILNILMGVWFHFDQIFISLMTNKIEHLFLYWMAIWIASFVKWAFKSCLFLTDV